VCFLISLLAMIPNSENNPNQATADAFNRLNHTQYVLACPFVLYGSVYGATRDQLKLTSQAAADFTCLLMLLVLCIAGSYFEKKVESQIDKDLITTRDFAVVVMNPPKKYRDISDYVEYFSQFGEVISITIATRNGDLIKELMHKTHLETRMYRMLATNFRSDFRSIDELIANEPKLPFWKIALQPLGLFPTMEYYHKCHVQCKVRLEEMISAKHERPPWRVFCVFNTEKAREKCLHMTELGFWNILFPESSVAAFKGKYLLRIRRPEEPSEIIYEHSHVSYASRIGQITLSAVLCGIVLVICGAIIQQLLLIKGRGRDETSSVQFYGAVVFISLINVALPDICLAITNMVEAHKSKGEREISILVKFTVVRCITNAVIYFWTLDFDDQFQFENLLQISMILIGDCIVSPLIKLANIPDRLVRHVVSPYVARTQEEMNSMWQGTDWNLAERYSSIFKSLFTCMFFSAIIPSAYLIIGIGLIMNYAVDKYNLLSVWRRDAVDFDTSDSTASRYIMFAIIWAHIVVTKYYFANWPFGGLGSMLDKGGQVNCNVFLCERSKAMTTSQTRIVAIYEVLSILCFITWFFYFFGDSLLKTLRLFGLITSVEEYEQPDDPDNPPTRFRNTHRHLYVPHIIPKGLTHANYCVDITGIPPRHIPAHDGIDDLGALCVAKRENFPHLHLDESVKLTDFFGEIYFNGGKGSARISTLNTVVGGTESSNKRNIKSSRMSTMLRATAFKVVDDRPLPPGWEMSRTAEDVVFYVDHINKITQTSFPTANQIEASPKSSIILADGRILF